MLPSQTCFATEPPRQTTPASCSHSGPSAKNPHLALNSWGLHLGKSRLFRGRPTHIAVLEHLAQAVSGHVLWTLPPHWGRPRPFRQGSESVARLPGGMGGAGLGQQGLRWGHALIDGGGARPQAWPQGPASIGARGSGGPLSSAGRLSSASVPQAREGGEEEALQPSCSLRTRPKEDQGLCIATSRCCGCLGLSDVRVGWITKPGMGGPGQVAAGRPGGWTSNWPSSPQTSSAFLPVCLRRERRPRCSGRAHRHQLLPIQVLEHQGTILAQPGPQSLPNSALKELETFKWCDFFGRRDSKPRKRPAELLLKTVRLSQVGT